MGVYWNENDMVLKLLIPTVLEHGDYYGQVMFGREKLKQEGEEVVAQKWNAIVEKEKALVVLNRGSYGSSEENGVIGLTLLHSAGYSAADGDYEKTLHEIRHTVRMEQGERLFSFRLEAGERALMDSVDKDAQAYNEEPYAFAFNPSGGGEKRAPALLVDNEQIVVSACKKAGSERGYVIRVYESAGKENEACLSLPWAGVSKNLFFKPFEIKTLLFDETTAEMKEVDITE